MQNDGHQSEGSVGDVLSKIGKAVSDGAVGDGPPELLLTEDMRVWDSVPVAFAHSGSRVSPAAPAIDEARIQALVAQSVLKELESNPNIGVLIRRAAKPKLEDVQAAMREAVGPMVAAAVEERQSKVQQAVGPMIEAVVAERQGAMREEIGPLIEAAVAERQGELQQAVGPLVEAAVTERQAAMREAVGPMVQAAVAEHLDELKQVLADAVEQKVAEARAAYEAADEGRKKQARKAVRAELKALLSSFDEE
jgi:hypothetical protein